MQDSPLKARRYSRPPSSVNHKTLTRCDKDMKGMASIDRRESPSSSFSQISDSDLSFFPQNKKQDDEDNFREQPDWHAPGLAEDRIHQLIKVHTDQMKYPPSFISLHSGRKFPPHFCTSLTDAQNGL